MLNKAEMAKVKERVRGKGRLMFAFRALADKNRLSLFLALHDTGELCVTDAARALEVSVPAASQQLRILELAGIVKRERRGQMIYYAVENRDQLVRGIMKLFTVR